MDLVCTPDVGIPMPPEGIPYAQLRERAAAACRTIDYLGLSPESTPEDAEIAAGVVNAFAANEVKTNNSLDTRTFSKIPPAALIEVNDLLTEFGNAVIKSSVQIRHLVANKLLLETANPDAKVRIRALELLGKMSDVGLFTERSEVTVTHRSTDDLKLSLRDKLEQLRRKTNKDAAIDGNLVSPAALAPPPDAVIENLDVELGISAPEAVQ